MEAQVKLAAFCRSILTALINYKSNSKYGQERSAYHGQFGRHLKLPLYPEDQHALLGIHLGIPF